MDYTQLVNKENTLDKDFIPDDLVIVDENKNNFHRYIDLTLKPMVSSIVFDAFLVLQNEAQKDGLELIIDSGYRSYEYQYKIYGYYINRRGIEYAKKYVALPGCSEHQTGLAVDVAAFHNGDYSDNLNSEEIEWLKNNAHKYGFILRYPEGKEKVTGYNYEPWHYRYVGKIAPLLYRDNITLEEYHLNKEYYDSIVSGDKGKLKKKRKKITDN